MKSLQNVEQPVVRIKTNYGTKQWVREAVEMALENINRKENLT